MLFFRCGAAPLHISKGWRIPGSPGLPVPWSRGPCGSGTPFFKGVAGCFRSKGRGRILLFPGVAAVFSFKFVSNLPLVPVVPVVPLVPM